MTSHEVTKGSMVVDDIDNGLCREPYWYCPDCEKGIKPTGIEVEPGYWVDIPLGSKK